MQERYEPSVLEPQAQAYWDEQRQLRRRRGPVAPEVLLPLHVPVPERAPAHGTRSQLHDRRRDHALHAHAGLQRAAADGLGRVRPARRERRDGERRAACEVDVRQHRLHEAAAAVARLRHRLVARGRHLQARLLPLEPVAVPAHAREGHRLPQDRHGQLGPRGPDRARQRAGDRRPRLAHRRAGREARDPDVLPRHHPVRRRPARRAERHAGLARARAADAGELDRPLRGPRDRVRGRRRRHARHLHDASGHAARRHLHGRRGRAPARAARRAGQPRPAAVHRRVPAQRRHRSRARDDGKARHAARHPRHPPDQRRTRPGVGRELRADGLRHRRGDGRARARPARLRVCAPLRPAHPSGRAAGGRLARPTSTRRRTSSTAR